MQDVTDEPGTACRPPGSQPLATGKAYWRSLDELADTPAFRDWVERRFPAVDARAARRRGRPAAVPATDGGVARPGRAGGLPPARAPGPPLHQAPRGGRAGAAQLSTPRPCPGRGSAFPILVESHEGRPTKIEGNPRHPDSGGSSDALAQASVLDLYDPDRSSPVLQKGQPSTWEAYDAFAAEHFAALRERKGKGLRRPERGRGVAVPRPAARAPAGGHARGALAHLRADQPRPTPGPARRWPSDRRSCRAISSIAPRSSCRSTATSSAWRRTAGRHIRGFAEARLARGADRRDEPALRGREPVLAHGRDGRSPAPAAVQPGGRLHPGPGSRAARRATTWCLPPGSPQAALRQALAAFKPSVRLDERWVREVAADLRAHAGKGIIVAGRRQPPLVHALASAMNAALGNLGKTVELRKPPARPASGTLEELAEAIDKGRSRPWSSSAATRVQRAGRSRVRRSDEAGRDHDPAGTARRRDVAAGDLAPARRALPGVVGRRPDRRWDGRADPAADRAALRRAERASRWSPGWPSSRRRRPTRSSAARSGRSAASPRPTSRPPGGDSCTTGLLAGSALSGRATRLAVGRRSPRRVAAAKPGPGPLSAENLELVLDRDAKVDDGRFANNGWLQELPDPVTKLTWDNAALFSPKTAQALGVANGDVVRLDLDGRSLEIAAMILPGQADFSVAVPLGYGRTACRPRRPGRGLQRLRPPHDRRARYRRRPEGRPDRPDVPPGLHPGPFHDGGARPGPRAIPGRLAGQARLAMPTRRSCAKSQTARSSTASISGAWRST